MAKKDEKKPEKIIAATHHKARIAYEILDTFEAGISLLGPEVKSLRMGKSSLDGCFGREERGELLLYNFYIAPYAYAHGDVPDPRRTRRLLLHKNEINRIAGKLQTKGLTLIPLEIYFLHGWVKVSLGLARGKKGPDKRADLKKKDLAREAEKSFKGRYRG